MDVGHRRLIRGRILERSHTTVARGVQQVNKQCVGIAVPIADVAKSQRRAGNGFASEIHTVDAPGIRVMVIQTELVGSATALVGARRRRSKSDHVCGSNRGQSEHHSSSDQRQKCSAASFLIFLSPCEMKSEPGAVATW